MEKLCETIQVQTSTETLQVNTIDARKREVLTELIEVVCTHSVDGYPLKSVRVRREWV